MNSSTMPQSQPIPLIKFQSDKFKITEQAISFIKALPGPIGIITIVGKYRTGKSLFLNKVLLNNHSFKVCPTINSCTKGLWLSRQVIKSESPDAQDMDVLVIDSEGFGAMEETDAYNNRILLFAMLLSSYFIYNSVGSIDEKNLNNLNVITNLAKELQSKNTHNDKIQEEFPTFMWIVRDFTLKLVDSNGCQMEPKEYLEYALEIQKGISDAVESKNKIRRMIKHFFKERDCYTLVTPVENEADLQQLNSLPDSALRPQFLQQVQVLRQKILKRVKPKKIKNKKLTGETFLQLANSYIDAINNGSLPNIDSAWKSVTRFQLSKTMTKAKQIITQKSHHFISTLRSQQSFSTFQQQLTSQILGYLRKNITNESDFQNHSKELKQYIASNIANARIKNREASMQVLLKHFHERDEGLYEENCEGLESRWRELEKGYKSQFGANPCLQKFFLQHFYPLKFEAFSSLLKRQHDKIKSEQVQKQNLRQLFTKKHQQDEQANRSHEHRIMEQQRELAFIKAKYEEEERIKGIEMGYMRRQLNEVKEELGQSQDKIKQMIEEIKQKDKDLFDLKIELSGANSRLRELENQRTLTLKELQILKNNLTSKNKEIQQLKMLNYDTKTQLERQQERQKNLHSYTRTQIEAKSEQLQQFSYKCQSLQRQNESYRQKITKLEAQLELQTLRMSKQQKMYQAVIETLKSNYETQKQHMIELTEANRNMAFALRHLEQRFEQAEQKQKKMKQFKKCFKNSSCMQCQNCSKFFVPSIFPQHLNICILSPQNFSKIEGSKQKPSTQIAEIEVKQTLLKDSDSKPYTEYLLEIRKAGKVWSISRKYKDFCALHSQLKVIFPGINISDYSYIVNPQEGSKKSLPVQQRKKILQKYMRDLSQNPHIAQQLAWKEFIGDTSVEGTIPITVISNSNNKKMQRQRERQRKGRGLQYGYGNDDMTLREQEQQREKENSFEENRINHKTPEEFLRIWNQRNLRTKQVSKNKKIKL